MRIAATLCACLGLAACLEAPADKPEPGDCGSGEMGHLMGIQRAQLETIAFTQPHRILGPNDVMTMDFNPERVNFTLDESGTVVRIWCG